jgi:cytochrome c553
LTARPLHLALALFVGVVGARVAVAQSAPPTPEGAEFFETKIRPVLVDSCYRCHSAEAEGGKVKGGLRLDTREGMLKGGESGKPAVVPGNAGASLLVEAIRHTNADLQMPPKKKLGERQVADFVAWINMGAPDPRATPALSPPVTKAQDRRNFWAFQAPKHPPVPQVKDATWARTPIDRFVLAKLEERGLRPSPEADKRTLIRRVTFDLTGLPPTPEEVEAFEADTSPDAYDKLVDRLLASPRYGERWGRHWLDLARYSDTKGYVYSDREETQFVHAYAYRDWVIQALNRDLPYDRFLMLQIAADQLVPPDAADKSDLAAVGFLTVGRRFLGIPHDIIDDRIDVLTRTTQGLTVACARCHDHKFDPIPTDDYYSLYGVFANSAERTAPLLRDVPKTRAYEEYQAELKKRTDKLESTFKAKRDDMVDRLRKKAPDYLLAVLDAEKLPNELFYENVDPDDVNRVVVRQWQQYLFARGRRGFDPVFAVWHALAGVPEKEFAPRAAEEVKVLAQSPVKKLNPLVAAAFAAKPPASMKVVATTYGRLLAEVDKAWREASKANPKLTELTGADREQLRQILYGADSPATVPSGSIADIEWFFPEGVRVELGKLQKDIDHLNITHPGAPAHAVYLVDRETIVKPRVFKRGNPATKGDEVPIRYLSIVAGEKRQPFKNGSGRLEMAKAIVSKDNPLTARVMVNRVWAWHFGAGLVTTPSDFGTRCEPPSHPELLDYLARRFVEGNWSIKRLHRDILLSSAYRQRGDDSAAGASVDPSNRLLWKFNRQRLDFESMRDSLLAVSGELDCAAGGRPVDMFASPRRSVYGKVDRQFVPGVFRVFDFANPDLHIPQRPTTTVPQQALFFMNSPFLADRAKALAARREVAAAPTPQDKVRVLYRLCYQRPPTGHQEQAALAFLSEQQLAAARQPPPPPPPPPSAWQYGFGELDASAGRLKSFTKLPHFTGTAWQGGANWPDKKLGWVQLTAAGGHAGDDLAHAAVRRFVAPRDLTVSITGTIRHAHDEGDGVVATIVSSRHGVLARYTLHHQSASASIEPVALQKGDTLDFVVDRHDNLNSDDFEWSPGIKDLSPSPADPSAPKQWDAKKEFAGIPATPPPPPPTPLELYAQVLLESNEFLFVD